jgi:choline-sulfatase
MLTGRYPHETGILSNEKAPFEPAAWPTIGTLFKRAGYATGYVGKWHLPYPITDVASGFDYTANIRNNGVDHATPAAVVTFLQQKREQPFLLFASFINPHNICEWPRGQKLPDGPIGEPPPPEECPPAPSNLARQKDEPDALTAAQRQYHANPQFPVGDYDENRWRQYRWAYYRMLEKVDALIGDVLAALEATGHAGNTVVVFTSDHGDCQGVHGWNQKTVFYDESSRVPFIVCAPGSSPVGRDCRQLVQTGVDLLPTLCDFAGIAKPETLHGRSHCAAAEGRASDDPRQFVVASNRLAQGTVLPGVAMMPAGRMLRTDRYKYCVYDLGQQRESLVDMERDPGEMTNLAGDPAYATQLNEHRATILAWGRDTGDKRFPYIAVTKP